MVVGINKMTTQLLLSLLLLFLAEFLTRGVLLKRINLLEKYKLEEAGGGVPNLHKPWWANREITLIAYILFGRFKKAKDAKLKVLAEILRFEFVILLALSIMCFLAIKGY
jgi:hypothetical protein